MLIRQLPGLLLLLLQMALLLLLLPLPLFLLLRLCLVLLCRILLLLLALLLLLGVGNLLLSLLGVRVAKGRNTISSSGTQCASMLLISASTIAALQLQLLIMQG
jgi:hypothetical protein